MAAVDPRMLDLVWADRHEYEAVFHKRPACTYGEATVAATTAKPAAAPAKPAAAALKPATKKPTSTVCADGKDLLAELEAARGFIRASLENTTTVTTEQSLLDRATRLETSNGSLRKIVDELTAQIERLESKLGNAAPVAAASKPAAKKEESDDDFNFSDSEEEDAAPKESAMERMKRMGAEKKAADAAKADVHVGPITKSNVVMDCKPWDDETDLKEMEAAVRAIKMEGLTWGDAKYVEIGYGIKKLRISNCIVDHLVGLYDLEEKLTDLEDFIQSVDIVSHNKI